MPVRARREGGMERLPCTETLKAGFCWKTLLACTSLAKHGTKLSSLP